MNRRQPKQGTDFTRWTYREAGWHDSVLGAGEQKPDAVNTLLCFDAVTSILPKKRKNTVYKCHTILQALDTKH